MDRRTFFATLLALWATPSVKPRPRFEPVIIPPLPEGITWDELVPLSPEDQLRFSRRLKIPLDTIV